MRPWSLFFTEYSGKIIEAASHKKGRNPNFFGYFQNPEKAAKKSKWGKHWGNKNAASKISNFLTEKTAIKRTKSGVF
jgi:hypothetical protein